MSSPAKAAGKQEAYRGGKQARPWDLRFWSGMNLKGWTRLLRKNGFRVSPSRWAMAASHSFLASLHSSLWLIQEMLYGRSIETTEIPEHPIFILGHWRSGTTLLHELLVLDPRHTFASTYACFAANDYLLTRHMFPWLLSLLMPDRRPMDNMASGLHRPQEDEFALCAMGQPSPYLSIAFPNEPPQDENYLNLEGLSPEALAAWKRDFLWFLQCVSVADPKRIVLKSPPHTGRVRVLLEMFPRAKFVHIVRDPFVLFASTVNLWKRLYEDEGFQVPRHDGLEERVFRDFTRMYEAFERDRHLIPPGQLSEVRYESLTRQPLAEMQRIYEELGLGGFGGVRPAIQRYFQKQSDYKKNRYEMPADTRAEVARRWAGYFDRYGYATEAAGSERRAADPSKAVC